MQTGRLTEIQNWDNHLLLNKLHLFAERGELTRAAILLFHNDPERWIKGAFIKIAAFDTNGELRFQDSVNGSLIEQIDKTLDLLKTKYLTYDISFEGASRRERLRLPEIALRESLLNAIAHKDYSDPTPTQIKVYPHKVAFWNAGRLPENWSIQTLWNGHHSKPFNSLIADALLRSGDIESIGSGYERIERAMREYQLPKPDVTVLGGLQISYISNLTAWWLQQGLSDDQITILQFAYNNGRISNQQIQNLLSISSATAKRLLNELSPFMQKHGERGRNVFYTIKL